jgi:hypothetical protein
METGPLLMLVVSLLFVVVLTTDRTVLAFDDVVPDPVVVGCAIVQHDAVVVFFVAGDGAGVVLVVGRGG